MIGAARLDLQPLLRREQINRRQSVVADTVFGKANGEPPGPRQAGRRGRFGNSDCKAMAKR